MSAKRYPTKIIPPLCEKTFLRERLFELVENNKSASVLWINGPPGAGKTSFVCSLLKKQKTEFLWYRMDAGDKDMTDIFYFLGLAAERNNPRKRMKLPVFSSEYTGNIVGFAKVFFRQLFSFLSKEKVIVFDNCQALGKGDSFYRIIQIALNELPQDMQIYCISRNRPPPELSRLKLDNALCEIGAIELKFNKNESLAFLKKLRPQITDSNLQYLQSKTQGWAAGMVLMVEQFSLEGTLSIFDNNLENKGISEYLGNEILIQIDNELRKFLIQTALFTQFTADMSQELTNCPQAQLFLGDLVKKNFLIERTAERVPSYIYHPLFRELLLNQAKMQYSDADWQVLQTKAADILVKHEKTDEAIFLYQQLHDWLALKKLLLEHADGLINMGRHYSVKKWMEALPTEYLKEDAWLNYWYAVALKSIDPVLTSSLMEQSYHQFIADNDTIGVYSAWQAAVESICISMDDYSALNTWLTRFDDLRHNFPTCPSLELKIRFYATAVQAFSFYNPQHPWLKGLVRISESLVRFFPVKMIKMMIYTQLGHYYLFSGQITKFQVIAPYLELAAKDNAIPVLPRIMNTYLLGIFNQYQGEGDKALTILHKGLALSEEYSIKIFNGLIYAHIVSSHICKGDFDSAQKSLKQVIKHISLHQRMQVAYYHSTAAWVSSLAGDYELALEQNQQALQLTQRISVEIGYVCSLALKVQLLVEIHQYGKAEQAFSLLSRTIKKSETYFNLLQYHLTDAWLGYMLNDQSRSLSGIGHFLEIVRREQMVCFFGWRPGVLVPLCCMAIENGIEEEFATKMLKLNQLIPAPSIHFEKWPWPVRVYCFETFTVEIQGKKLEATGKSQMKILELLQCIIAFGGRDVESNKLVNVLWPLSDGDCAHQSMETALYRLRKIIGKESVIVKSGKVSLSERHCWIDQWAFDQTAEELNENLNSASDHKLIKKLTDRLFNIYRGSFLCDQESGWEQLKREQQQNKLLNLIERLSLYYEKQFDIQRARYLLKKGIELAPLLESGYMLLVKHYINLEQPNNALTVYQQCENTFKVELGIQLSPKMQKLVAQCC